MRPGDFRPDVNGLRAIAVILVLLFHFNIPYFRGGFVGVDVFFVISGLLMTQIIVTRLRQGRFRVSDFYLARPRRILPALLVLCAFLLALGWLSVAPVQYDALGRQVATSVTFLSNMLFWREAGYFDAVAHEKWLLHTWSLSVEWQFYLLLPLLLAGTWRLTRRNSAIVGVVFLTGIASLAVSVLMSPRHPDAAYYATPTRVWEFAAGGLVFLLVPYPLRSPRVSKWLGRIGVACILASAVLLGAGDPWPGYHALFPVLGTAAVVASADRSSALAGSSSMQFVGTASYSIYLWHWPVMLMIRHLGLSERRLAAAAGIGLSVLLGYLSLRLVETPTRRMGERVKPANEALAYLGAIAVLASVALAVDMRDGFPSRLGNSERTYRAIAAASDDWVYPGDNCIEERYHTRCNNPGVGSKSLFVVGDSLAEQWYARYGVQSIQSHSVVFFTKGGCPPVRGIKAVYASSLDCEGFAEAAWREILDSRPDTVLIASIWTTYFFTRDGEPKQTFCRQVGSMCLPVSDEQSLAKAFEQLAADVSKATKLGIRVVILGPMPLASADPVRTALDQVATTELSMSIDTRTLRQSATSPGVEGQETIASSILKRSLAVVAQRGSATLIDPRTFMCPQGTCSFIGADGVPLYKDADHLRAAYASSPTFGWIDSVLDVNR